MRITPPAAVLADLLMAVMDSVAVWQAAAGEARRGLAWRDAVTARMVAARTYLPYEALVAEVAAAQGLPARAVSELWAGWRRMRPRPDAAALAGMDVPLGFVTNCSARLAGIAAARSGLAAALVLSAAEAGAFKPVPAVYRRACDALGVAPEDALYVAGAPYDAAGAQAAGLRAVLVARRPELGGMNGPWRTVRSLDELVDPLS